MERNPQAAIDVDIERLARSLREEMQRLQPLSDEYNSIYRVPKLLHELNEMAYTPQVVSIGPLHYGTDKLRPMEEHKRRYFQAFLRRTEEASVVDFLSIVRENEDRLRGSYAEDIKLGSEEFVEMVLVDAGFIIEMLLRSTFSKLQNRNDRIFSKPWIADIMLDMCLLENQLPFFILRELCAKIPTAPPIIELIHGFAKEYWDVSVMDADNLNNERFNNVKHLVDFFRICLVPPKREGLSGKMKTPTMPTVTELHQAGVKFKAAAKKGLFEIRFKEGCLEIPHLKIVKETELLFRNLLAFERYHGSTNCIMINDFIVLISHLLNTPKDVDLLIQFGIIENRLFDRDGVSTLFHSLVKETIIIPTNFYFSGIVEEMNSYCRNLTPWHKWKATLKQDCSQNPWKGILAFAVILLLALNCIRTVYSVESVLKN